MTATPSSLFTDRSSAINALRSYQSASLIVSMTALVDHLDQTYGPSGLDSLGKITRLVPRENLDVEFSKLAKINKGGWPTLASLKSAAMTAASKSGVGVGGALAAVGKDTVEGAASAISSALKWGLPLAVAGAVLYFVFQPKAAKWIAGQTKKWTAKKKRS